LDANSRQSGSVLKANQQAAFTAAVQQAIAQADQGNIVILGVTPDKPETGYGYIKVAGHCEERSDAAIQTLTIEAFVEKPNQATAEAYIKEGGYYWNAGMFVLKASVWLVYCRHARFFRAHV
jgi:mannose-1-phosphate guanylyltransferase/mannose-6-phosphate isomerase